MLSWKCCYGEVIPDCSPQPFRKQICQALPFTAELFQNLVILGTLHRGWLWYEGLLSLKTNQKTYLRNTPDKMMKKVTGIWYVLLTLN